MSNFSSKFSDMLVHKILKFGKWFLSVKFNKVAI